MYRKSTKDWFKHLDFMIVDLVCLQAAFLLSYWFRHGVHNAYGTTIYRNMALVITFIDAVVMAFSGTLKNVLKRGYWREFCITVRHVCLVVLLAVFYLFLTQEGSGYSRISLVSMGILYGVLDYLGRCLWKWHLKRSRQASVGNRSLLIVTTSDRLEDIVKSITKHNYERFRIAGAAVIDRDLAGQTVCGIPVVAGKEDVVGYVSREWIDEIFLDLPYEMMLAEELDAKFAEMGVVVHMKIVNTMELSERKRFVEKIGNYTVLTTSINYATAGQLFLKRALDIAGGLVGCLITGILFLFLAPAIYIKSPGPIFFSQVRVGKNGRKFRIYKFRSMYMDAEERKKELMAQNRVKDGMMFKLDWDPRIIGSKKLPDGTVKKGIGNYIRDWSLDEFPQFFNVLKGDMSLVGTRPPTVDEWEKYELHHRARLAIKPGVTGMWQVSGRSDITDFEEVVRLDKEYIENWNIGLDIKILLKTVLVVFRKDGSM